MRLIDARAGKKAFLAIAQPAEYRGVIHMVVPISEIDKLPTVDAVEVVRCKDCKFGVIPYGDEHDGLIECSNIHGRPLFSCDGFCSYGERRSDG